MALSKRRIEPNTEWKRKESYKYLGTIRECNGKLEGIEERMRKAEGEEELRKKTFLRKKEKSGNFFLN